MKSLSVNSLIRISAWIVVVLSLCSITSYAFSAEKAKKSNVILMVADGAGVATYQAAADFQTGSPTGVAYMQAPWKFFTCSTYSIAGEYEPEEMWTNFKKHKGGATDSAAAATAINTGVKTDNGTIGLDDDQELLETFAEKASKNGFSCGAITSVQISHATPAGVAGHVKSRKEGQKLFDQMLNGGALTVMMGCGHPEFDDQGRKLPEHKSVNSDKTYYTNPDGTRQWVEYNTYGPSPAAWAKIRNNDLPDGWTVIESREDFQKLASGQSPLPKKVLGLAQAHSTLTKLNPREPIPTVPTLAEESLAALNVLNQNPKGFYLMVEGGAVDWCNHNNKLKETMVEMKEFNDAIAAVCDWVEKNSSWDETMVIITADHETGALWGPEADEEKSLFQKIQFNGKGNLPTHKYYSGGHTNQLVPFYVRGKNVEIIDKCIKGTDSFYGKLWNYDGRFIDNTDIVPIMTYVLGL